jgi:hypothetical protein
MHVFVETSHTRPACFWLLLLLYLVPCKFERCSAIDWRKCRSHRRCAGDRGARLVGGLLLRELARGAAEAFAGQAAAALPTAFVAARDEDADVAAAWADVWEEGTSSGAGAARLYAADIVPLIARGAAPGQTCLHCYHPPCLPLCWHICLPTTV